MARQGWKLEWLPGASAGERFEALVGLHRERWRKRGLPGVFWGQRLAFHRRFLSREGHGALLCAVREGEVGGVLYLLRTRDRWAYYQAGIRSGPGLSLGTFLIDGAIRIAREEGARWFDFLRGEEPYKRRWAPDGEYAIFRSDPLMPATSRIALWTERLKVRFESSF
jgi:CelD/BcsL family acetyltransferase involved in cellulose biosynthesis